MRGATVERNGTEHDAGGQQHGRRDAIGAQHQAERRRPAADEIDQRCAAAIDAGSDQPSQQDIEAEHGQRDALRAPPAEDEGDQHAADRQHKGEHQQPATGRRRCHPSCGPRAVRRLRDGRGAGDLVHPQRQDDGERGRGKGDDEAGDDHGLRHRVHVEARRRAAPRHYAEEQEDAAAEQVEGEHLAQHRRLRDQSEQAERDQRHSGEAEQHRAVHAARSGGPATSRARAAATERVIAASISRISGLAKAGG